MDLVGLPVCLELCSLNEKRYFECCVHLFLCYCYTNVFRIQESENGAQNQNRKEDYQRRKNVADFGSIYRVSIRIKIEAILIT